MTGRVLCAGVALLASLAALPSAAGAASISREERDGLLAIYYDGDDLSDRFNVTDDATVAVFTQEEGGQGLFAGDGCTQASATEPMVVRCPAADDMVVDTKGGADSANLSETGGSTCVVTLRGGPGDDELDGADDSAEGCRDTIDGGAGSDTIVANLGNDLLRGGADEDSIQPGPGADDVDGGDGADTVVYEERVAPVSVTFDDRADDGEPGESDNVRSNVENALGGAGADTLLGTASGNRLVGGGGNDRLVGGAGADRLSGGDGDDRLDAGDSEPDEVDCGAGSDTATIDARDAPVRDCETATNVDADGDFYRNDAEPRDCDDRNAAVNPGAREIPENGVDDDCAGGDQVNLDRDADGVQRPLDCNDADPAIPRPEVIGNAVDENCDGIAAPFPHVLSPIANRWDADARSTRILRLVIRLVPEGGAVEVRCRGRGRSCPFKRRTFTPRRGSVDVGRRFRGRRLRRGTVLEVRISAPASIAKVVRFTIRPRRDPRTTTYCLPPGAQRLERC